ncbi:MAG TPA: endonuclease domain-containing protein [Acetobacteraceae bacterium]|nr:endonuclease domain-containing protein [Acetobacteraceae bacterium]
MSVEHARAMRREATPAERALWRGLQARRLGGLKFRRQVPIGPFVVDFYCPEAKLVIEVDGETHADPSADADRTAFLEARGMGVIRFWNNEVLGNLEGVLEGIARAASSPPPLEGGGRGEEGARRTKLRVQRSRDKSADPSLDTPPPAPVPQGEGAPKIPSP